MDGSTKQLLNEVMSDVEYQWNMHGIPTKLRNLSVKYNKRATKLNVKLIDIIRSDDRFICKTNPNTGGWFIAPLKGIDETFSDVEDINEREKMISTYWDHAAK